MVAGVDEGGRSADTAPPARPLGLRAFEGVRFAGDPGTVLHRTMDPPDSWVTGRTGRGARSGVVGGPTADPPGAGASHDDDSHPHVARLAEQVFVRSGTARRAGPADLDAWLTSGVVVRDRPSLYVYRRTETPGSTRVADPTATETGATTRSTRGLLGALDLSGRTSAPLLPHEGVRPGLVLAQRELTEATRAQLDPVVALAGPPPTSSDGTGAEVAAGRSPLALLLDRLTAEPPDWVARDAGSVHELWIRNAEDELRAAAEVPVGTLLVADGHHRRRAWSAGEGAPWGLAWVVDSEVEPLRLQAVHRLCPGLRLETVLGSPLVRTATLEGPEAAQDALTSDGSACVVHDGERWLLVRPAEDAPDPGCVLPDHALCRLHDQWLPAWGVVDAGVEHVHGFETAAALATSDRCAVLLPAAPLAAVEDAARAGTVLPAKATSFVPKARVGLVMRHWRRPGDDVRRPEQTTGAAGTG